ncbi:MAG: DUF3048 domain-containing protein [Candidatus Kuenenbacteria bacterium]
MELKLNHVLKLQLFILIAIFLILELVLAYNLWNLIQAKQPVHIMEGIDNHSGIIADETVSRRIDGLPVLNGRENLYPAAVVIDNHPASRSNYGLSAASVVYEAHVENGATRFLALYTPNSEQENTIKKIGPVRSARPYFVEIAKEYDALFAHAGGSPQAIKYITKLEVHSMDEIAWWGPDYYWRVYSRQAPHNLFISEENLAKAVIDWQLGEKIPDYRAWKFSDELDNMQGEKAEEVYVDFSLGADFDVKYVYNTTTQSYLRFQGEEEHMDAINNRQISAANIVIQYIPREIVLDVVGRLHLDLIGQGKALIFRDGIKISGSWKRRSLESRTIFYNQQDEEIHFKPGNIWIAITDK